jgi:NAD(P)-dependent dehydrogenase (short-subunit alcohol dehydrogenase family)
VAARRRVERQDRDPGGRGSTEAREVTSGRLAGRVVLVTGGTSGIGKVSAREIARCGASVLIVGRYPDRTRSVAEALRLESGNPSVFDLAADLSLQSEVARLAREVRDRFPRLDVLINNAGAIYSTREETPEGHERTWSLNVLAPFLLIRLLEDRLRAAPNARVVNVSSAAHRGARVDLGDPERRHRYSGFGAYSQSKLALLLLTYEWARRLCGTKVCANALHPGFVSTRFGRANPGWFGRGIALAEFLFGLSAERGARTTVFLATSPRVDGVSGRYFGRSGERRSSRASYDRDLAVALFQLCWEQTQPFSAASAAT